MGRFVGIRKVEETAMAVTYEVDTGPSHPRTILVIDKADPQRDAGSFATGTEAWAYRRIVALHERDGAWPKQHLHQS